MKDDAYRRILQLERKVQSLTDQVEAVRNSRRSIPSPGNPVILQAVSDITARAVAGSDWSVYRGNARIYNLQVRGNINIASAFTLSKITGDSVDRLVPLINLWDVKIKADSFVLAMPFEGYYVTASPPFGLFRYTLNAGWSSGSAAADLLLMDGTDTGTDITLKDPLSVFSTQSTNDAGYCILWGGDYYAIQAPCPA